MFVLKLWFGISIDTNLHFSCLNYDIYNPSNTTICRMGPVAVELPECPVCMDIMSAPIYQCQSGHSLCNSCTKVLVPSICPICRQPMTQMRNWQLEDLISKV